MYSSFLKNQIKYFSNGCINLFLYQEFVKLLWPRKIFENVLTTSLKLPFLLDDDVQRKYHSLY